jgi:hypothetical protein
MYKDKRWGADIKYFKCLNCLVQYHEEFEDPAEWYISGEYRALANIDDATYEQIGRNRVRRQVHWMDNVWPNWRARVNTILDVGAFRGVAVDYLRSIGFNATGYELDPKEAEKSDFVTSDISGIGNVDLIWMSHVLEHTKSPLNFLINWMGKAPFMFIEVPSNNYQLPHCTVFNYTALERVMNLASIRIVHHDARIRIIAETRIGEFDGQ